MKSAIAFNFRPGAVQVRPLICLLSNGQSLFVPLRVKSLLLNNVKRRNRRQHRDKE